MDDGISARMDGRGMNHLPFEDWPSDEGIPRVVEKCPHRKERIECLGNAVVPQQACPIFMAIAETEKVFSKVL